MGVADVGVVSSRASAAATAMFVRLNEVTNRTFVLPLLIVCPTSRCNSRCVSCDWWRHSGADDLALDDFEALSRELPALGTRVVAFSGGEPLLRPEVFDIARVFRARGMSLQLMTSGVLLERVADRVAEHFSRVYVSLDASTAPLYEAIRGVDALAIVKRGIARLRQLAPSVPVTVRATLHRANFRELPRLVDLARTLGVDGISFLPADVSSSAFGRERTPNPAALVLDSDDVEEFRAVVDRTIVAYRSDLESGFVAESAEKLRRIPQYYAALAGDGPFPPVRCNAPWVSVVVEANGMVRPCFFHAPVGDLRKTPLAAILHTSLPAFRRTLNVEESPVCEQCVCSINATWRSGPWQ
jgi:MoaA/NifB/PqqE/SkfB family radical SAM enzyme